MESQVRSFSKYTYMQYSSMLYIIVWRTTATLDVKMSVNVILVK